MVEHIHCRKVYDNLNLRIVLFFWEEQVWRRCFYTVYLSEHCNQDVSQSQLPSSLWFFTLSSAISLTFRSNVVLDRFDSLWFVPSSIQFVLFSLIFILFSSHHLFMLSKSFCIFSSIDSSDLDDPWIVVSSAKSAICEYLTWNGRSLMYNRNKIGPNTDPCGTPDFISLNFDSVVPIWTLCCRLFK